jgi:hypothetical protein
VTIRIPKGAVIVVGLLLALGGGVALGYAVADEPIPDPVTTTQVNTVTETQTETITEVPEFVGMLGERVLQELMDRGEIEDATPIDPKEGWESEFDLGVAGAVIRFRTEADTRHVEYEWFPTARGRQLRDVMREVVRARGYVLEE